MYLTYEEYTEYGGTLDETAFQDLEFDAETTIDWYTFNRLKRPEWQDVLVVKDDESLLEHPIKRCVYQLIRLKQIEDELLAASTGGGGIGVGWTKEAGITQESNDGVSVSYNTLSSGELMVYANGKKTKKDLVKRYLNGVINQLGRSLTYKGLYPGE